jgi:hypothetical protein
MRTILAIGIMLGFIVVFIVGLLSVLHDLLVRTSYQPPSPVDDSEESSQSMKRKATPLDISLR